MGQFGQSAGAKNSFFSSSLTSLRQGNATEWRQTQGSAYPCLAGTLPQCLYPLGDTNQVPSLSQQATFLFYSFLSSVTFDKSQTWILNAPG